MKKNYELVQTCLGMKKPFAFERAFTAKLLDTSTKMDANRVSGAADDQLFCGSRPYCSN